VNLGREGLFDRLKSLGLIERIRHADSLLPTAADVAQEFGFPMDRIARTVAAVTRHDKVVLVVGPASGRVDFRRIGQLIGAPIRTIPKGEVISRTGYPSDGVSPYIPASCGVVLIDSRLELHSNSSLLIAAGSGREVAQVTLAELERLSMGFVVDFDAIGSRLRCETDPAMSNLGIHARFVHIEGVDVKTSGASVDGLVERAVSHVLSGHRRPSGAYKKALAVAGVRDQTPSTELLYAYIERKRKFPRVNAVVDSYNAESVLLDVVASAHDADRLEGLLRLIRSSGDEEFLPIGADKITALQPGEWCIRDRNHLLCRNCCKQSEYSKIDYNSRNILIYLQGNSAQSVEDLAFMANSVARTLVLHCGGKRTPVLSPEWRKD
jgi:DNA/RNA-binding domain of Phe-tRNA-synthetase-like protein/prolyl-tRNA editing enzyme YbaK/EbsC (Cys-tRNA(Pro) deacylase)